MNMKDENKEKVDIELITAYAQMAFFTLQNSGDRNYTQSNKIWN